MMKKPSDILSWRYSYKRMSKWDDADDSTSKFERLNFGTESDFYAFGNYGLYSIQLPECFILIFK